MNLDQIAQRAAADAQQSGRAMPVVPIDDLRRRRLMLGVIPLVAAAVAVSVFALVFLLPRNQATPPAATSPTTPTTIAPGTTTPSAPTTTTVPTTTIPAEVVMPDTPWIRGTHQQILDADGAVLAEFPPTISYGRNTAWDGGDGFVALTESGLIWLRPSGQTTIDIPQGTILDLVRTDAGTHVIGVETALERTHHWFELESGDEVPAPTEGYTTLDGRTFTVGDRSVTIDDPDWSDVERDESGAPIPPFDLAELVVTENGTEVLRIPVGTEQRPYMEIHDFDGRRVIFAALPQEPAVPPSTVWIVDLECSDCTETVDTPSLEYFDVIGVLPSAGDVKEPTLP